jgi:hypothetical protein
MISDRNTRGNQHECRGDNLAQSLAPSLLTGYESVILSYHHIWLFRPGDEDELSMQALSER